MAIQKSGALAPASEISVLARSDTVLRAILADYEEISLWLEAEKSPVARDTDELERAQKLARELENEILNHLEKWNDNTS